MAADPHTLVSETGSSPEAAERPEVEAAGIAAREKAGARVGVLSQLGVQDWVVICMLSALLIGAAAGEGAARDRSLLNVAVLLTGTVISLFLVRSGVLRHAFFAPLVYRVGLFGGTQVSYFLLADLLPVANTGSLDQQLFDLDMALFGIEPAIDLASIVTPATSEWFSFFYFSYFFLLAVHVVPMLFFCRQRRLLAEFTLGMVLLVSVTHVSYMLVPGFGPVKLLDWQAELPSGLWNDLVQATVSSGGAQKDIFPSLHTGAPTFVFLFSYRNRARMPFRYTWPIVGFFALNIIVATMFMRWHWAIDVVAGLLWAFTASELVARIARWEVPARAAGGKQELFPRFFEQPN